MHKKKVVEQKVQEREREREQDMQILNSFIGYIIKCIWDVDVSERWREWVGLADEYAAYYATRVVLLQ